MEAEVTRIPIENVLWFTPEQIIVAAIALPLIYWACALCARAFKADLDGASMRRIRWD